MKIRIEKTIGKSKLTVEVDAEKDIDALVKASTISTMPDNCGRCKSGEVELVANKADQFTYVKVRCLNPRCNAMSTMGQYKDGSGGFWKAFEIYTGISEIEQGKNDALPGAMYPEVIQ